MRKAQRTRRTRRLLWRWWSNPLRRHDDVVEAWIVLAVWTVIALGGTLVGTLTAQATDQSLARLRAERHAVRAVLVESTARAVPVAAGVASDGRVRAKVRWTASDGSTRTGRAPVDSGQKAGARAVVWTDSKGQPTTQPPTATEAASQAGLVGAGAALAFGGVTFAAGRVALWRLDRRRYDQWGSEWALVGPQWRRRTT
ncbi:hypothetical protein [Streptomyces sp. WAC00263]|uniref:Rv1733c family protein n=1 Tax=Streptomyces sp. WAC00263 TaxID=1917422 RepID=UPI001F506AC2|nr:hypothetical protein [Streptomyces sp. WAC00263]